MGLLDGKAAIVTGGGTGIGQAVAVAFAREGAKVMVCGRRESALADTLAMMRAVGGEGAVMRADVSKAPDVEALVAATVARFGKLDVAFNNAGIFDGAGRLADLTEEAYANSFDTNVRSIFLCLKHQINQMLAQGHGGSIINNASAQSHLALGGSGHYTACKHAILGYTRAAAVDYARDNIRVNCISPGVTMTPMMGDFDPAAPENAGLIARIPAGRVATTDEIAGTVVFMASDMAPYLHGASIAVDGAWTAH